MKTYCIKVKVDDRYIKGRISGIIAAITYDEACKRIPYGQKPCYMDNGELLWTKLKFDATEEEFVLIKKIINKHYPGYCLFG